MGVMDGESQTIAAGGKGGRGGARECKCRQLFQSGL